MENVSQIFQILGSLGTIAGLLFLVWQVSSARKDANASRNLDIVLNLSESFRSRWESGWRVALREIKKEDNISNISQEHRDQLLNMLNWINWCGKILRGIDRSSSAQEILFESIGTQFDQIIKAGCPITSEGKQIKGSDHWEGVDEVEQRLQDYGIREQGS